MFMKSHLAQDEYEVISIKVKSLPVRVPGISGVAVVPHRIIELLFRGTPEALQWKFPAAKMVHEGKVGDFLISKLILSMNQPLTAFLP